jgi:hypothetical protein
MREEPIRPQPSEETPSQDFRDPGARSEAQRANERDYRRPAGPDRMPTPEEERLAEQQELPAGTAEHYQEMAERGAHQQGEGRIP